MKNIIFTSLLCILTCASAFGALPWWQQPTICRLDPTDCYKPMGTGYDSEMWDATSNCWGLKLICPEALKQSESNMPVPMGKAEIASGKNINQDYDLNKLQYDCFGARKTTSNGTMTSVNGEFVKIWCNGILDNVDETLSNGEISYTTQPTCKSLAVNGFVGILDKNCFGKYYDPAKYYIECGKDSLLPNRLIVLNGADYSLKPTNAPSTKEEAEKVFKKQLSVSEQQRKKYYSE